MENVYKKAQKVSPKTTKHPIGIGIIKFGEHLIFDAYGCNPNKLNNPNLCKEVMTHLCKLGNMRPLSEPYLVEATSNEMLGGKDPGGYSGFLIIQESHISIHTFVKRGFVTIDVYSCKSFESQKMVDYLKKTFESKDEQIIKLERGLKYPDRNIY